MPARIVRTNACAVRMFVGLDIGEMDFKVAQAVLARVTSRVSFEARATGVFADAGDGICGQRHCVGEKCR